MVGKSNAKGAGSPVLYKIYGVDIDFTNSNPTTSCTYTDDAIGMVAGSEDWKNTSIISALKSCILTSGVVTGYLREFDLSKYIDGTASPITTLGNDVMLEIGRRIGYLIEWDDTNTDLLHVKVTDNPNDADYNYDAFSLDAYNDCDKIYLGVHKAHCFNNLMYSSSGKAVTVSQTDGTFRTWARARGAGYQQQSFASFKLRQCIYLIFFKSMSSQATVGAGYSSTGNPSGAITGYTNIYGFNSEIAKLYYPTFMTVSTYLVKCLGIEDFWGNYYEVVDGIVSDASRNILTCQLAKDFNSDGTGYTNNGNGGVTGNIIGYMSRPQGGSNVGFVPKAVAGSDSTYFCDYCGLSASSIAICSGYWADGLRTGAFSLLINNPKTTTLASMTSRLMFMHKEV